MAKQKKVNKELTSKFSVQTRELFLEYVGDRVAKFIDSVEAPTESRNKSIIDFVNGVIRSIRSDQELLQKVATLLNDFSTKDLEALMAESKAKKKATQKTPKSQNKQESESVE